MKTLKKTTALTLVLTMCLSMLNLPAFAADGDHEHNQDGWKCVYTEPVKELNCKHEHDATCGYAPAVEGVPCDCTDTNGDGVIDHVDGCGYVEAVAETPCNHEHTDECYEVVTEGYWTCANVQAFLDAVTTVPEITEENWEDAQAKVSAAWDAYDDIYALWEKDHNIWTKEISEAYTKLDEAQKAVNAFRDAKEEAEAAAKLAACPFEGVWSKDEDGTNVLTITGEGTYEGEFALMEDGQRVKLVRKPNDKPYAVVLNVGEVGDNAFLRCSKLTKVTLGDDVTKIGVRGFEQTGVTSVNLDKVTELGNYAFCKAPLTGELVLDNVTSIGLGAFAYCNELTGIKLSHIGSFGHSVFLDCQNLTEATFTDCTEISYRAMRNCPALEKVTITNTETVGWLAFQGCSNLAEVTMSNVGLIEGGAFEDCAKLTTIKIDGNTKLGYVDAGRTLTEVIPGITDRVEAILKGEFALDSAETIVELSPADGWEDSKVAKSNNWNDYDYGTQLVEQARWTNADKTDAEVKVDAYYTAQKQMDYIFVLDLSNSMTKLGNSKDQNARFYDMQSKLLDVTDKLLTTPGYDCRVAFTTFGLDSTTSFGFCESSETARNAILSLAPYYENTNYGLGLRGAEALLKSQEAGRDTTVVFISDGQPRGDKTDIDGASAASKIKEDGVSIFGVLQSVPEDEHNNAVAAMKNVCSDGLFFESSDTESFSKAVNGAIAAAYTSHTVTIPVNPAFENVRGLTVSASAGEASYDEATHTITWTIIGMPFMKHTLTYQMSLTDENAALTGTRTYDVNSGSAVIDKGAVVETPQLSRTVSTSGGSSTTKYYTLTIYYVFEDGSEAAETHTDLRLTRGHAYSVESPVLEGYTADQLVVSGTMPGRNVEFTVHYAPVVVDEPDVDEPDVDEPDVDEPEVDEPEIDVPDEDTPLVDTPDVDIPEEEPPLAEEPEIEVPDEEPPLVEIPEENVPLDESPKTGDNSRVGLWAALCAGSLAALLAMGRKKEDEEA